MEKTFVRYEHRLSFLKGDIIKVTVHAANGWVYGNKIGRIQQQAPVGVQPLPLAVPREMSELLDKFNASKNGWFPPAATRFLD